MNFEKFNRRIEKEKYMDYAEWRNRLPKNPFPSIDVGDGGRSAKETSTKRVPVFDPKKHAYSGTLFGKALSRESKQDQ
ncbi:MAG: hypothetical protein WC022_02400 [Parcubacteria group bacterium]